MGFDSNARLVTHRNPCKTTSGDNSDFFNMKAKLAIVCPVSTKDKNFPLHVRLDERTVTTGVVLCDHVKSLDINSRSYVFIETMPKDILENVINKVFAEIETQEE